MQTTKPIRATLLGEQTAENDIKLLLPNFIETPEYRSIIETKDSTVVVGRRGTGKSAMFAKLKEFWGGQKGANVISIAPEDYETISFRALFKPFHEKYSYVRSVSRVAWKYGLIMEMLCHLAKHFKTRERISQFRTVEEHIKLWQASPGGFFNKLIKRLGPNLRSEKEVELVIGNIHSDIDLAEIEAQFFELLKSSSVRFFILIDRLDEGYENDEMGAAIVSGAIAVVAELNKKYDHVRPVIFQRDNILRAVQKFDPDYTRNIEGEVIPIHWDTHQLQNLVAKRLNSAFSLNIEHVQKIWDRCTANEGAGRELQGKDGFKKCLQFTLYRRPPGIE